MNELKTSKVSKIVAQNYKTARVFTAHGIDFCCGGGVALEEACEAHEADVEQVLTELQIAMKEPQEVDYQQMSLPALIGHIVKKHHQYVESSSPLLQAYLEKLKRVHGERHPELLAIRDLFDTAVGHLAAHMKKEELILFPFIQAMCGAFENGYPLSEPYFGHIDNPIHMMELEHSAEGERFREISRLSSGYTCPPDGCQTYQVAYAMLDEFEKDLHLHIHLENNILFPRAKVLFQTLQQRQSN